MSFQFNQQPPHMQISENELQGTFAAAMARVYLWMTLGLFITVGATLVTLYTPLFNIVFSSMLIPIGLFVVEIILVITISRAINRLSPTTALALFFLYAAINGLTLSAIFVIYSLGTIFLAFGTCAILFGVMSVVGFTTKQDLTSWGRLLFFGLIGLIIASIVNMFLGNGIIDLLLSYLGVAIFLGLTAYDTQMIKRMTAGGLAQGDTLVVSRVGVIGALRLYLDFINLFLYLLRIFGRRR